MARGYQYEKGSRAGIKMWTRGVPVEESALDQLRKVAALPFIHKHVAAMPDLHRGIGATVGSVIATTGAVVPAAVGVDIGCGMIARRTNLAASDLPDNLSGLRTQIERAVPHGRTQKGGGDRGAWGEVPDVVSNGTWPRLEKRYERITDKHPKATARNTANHLGTLGSGNHFIEVCLDEEDRVWAMLHSGSRGCGNRIGSYFIERAKGEMRRWHA